MESSNVPPASIADGVADGAGLPTVRVEGVSHNFGAVQALDDITFTIAGSGVVGLIGPNGSGKSTLIGVLSGLLKPFKGDVYIGSDRLTGKPAHRFNEAGVVRTFQQSRLVPDLRLWENLLVGCGAEKLRLLEGTGVKRRRIFGGPAPYLESLTDVASRFGLLDALDEWPEDLPSALQRKAEVARAMLSEPRLLLLDEPAAGLSVAEAESLTETLKAVAQATRVIIVEHNMQVIYGLAERVLVMMSGRLVADASPKEVAESPLIRKEYLGLE